MDLRVGGTYRIAMSHPDGRAQYLFVKYLEIEEPERLSMTWSLEGSDRDDGYEAILTLHFETLGDARTELLLQHSQLPKGSLSMYRAGWESVLAALQDAWLTGIGANADSPPDDLDSAAAETAFQEIVDVLSW